MFSAFCEGINRWVFATRPESLFTKPIMRALLAGLLSAISKVVDVRASGVSLP